MKTIACIASCIAHTAPTLFNGSQFAPFRVEQAAHGAILAGVVTHSPWGSLPREALHHWRDLGGGVSTTLVLARATATLLSTGMVTERRTVEAVRESLDRE